MSRAGEVWSIRWPGGAAVLLLLEGAEGLKLDDGKYMLRCLTLDSDDPETLPAGAEDRWADSWFSGKPQLLSSCHAWRVA